jgi:8-oxo-dGTP diphosphatase
VSVESLFTWAWNPQQTSRDVAMPIPSSPSESSQPKGKASDRDSLIGTIYTAAFAKARFVVTQSIHIAAALLIGADGKTLLVRKRDTTAFMQPGGKIEPGELALTALARELDEELGIQIDTTQAYFLGMFSAMTANEPGFDVHCELFRVIINVPVHAAAEIEEAVWVDRHSYTQMQLAPLTQNHVMPIYLNLC